MASLPLNTYSSSGVDRSLADQFVERIGGFSKETLNKKVKTGIGGYASLYEIDKKRWLAASVDGVGTKLKIAFQLNAHKTVGVDLVAMSVNDLLCVGAEPLFFLDYFATGKLQPSIADDVLSGIVEGCKLAGCALVGGETAEMPGFYLEGEYDLAGFAVGMVNPKAALPTTSIVPGDILIGISSNGFHSNGYSLLRKILADTKDQKQRDEMAQRLLEPTKIYVKSVLPLAKRKLFKGLAHITGSGFLNVPRMSDQVSYEIQLPTEDQRPVAFRWLLEKYPRNTETLREMAQTFNLGIGMVGVVASEKKEVVLKSLRRAGEIAWEIGRVLPKKTRQPSEVCVKDQEFSVVLEY